MHNGNFKEAKFDASSRPMKVRQCNYLTIQDPWNAGNMEVLDLKFLCLLNVGIKFIFRFESWCDLEIDISDKSL